MNTAEALLEAFNKLPPGEREKVSADADTILQGLVFTPQDGPQSEAYFSEADEVLYGGQAGGGKSAFLVGYGLNEAQEGVIFRNGFKNLVDLENFAVTLLGTDQYLQRALHTFRLPGGRMLELASLEQPGSELDRQGLRRDFVGFDEATQMLKSRVMFVLGWLGSTKAKRTRVVYATNPPMSDEGNWLFAWFAPWLDPMFEGPAKPGELRWFVNDKDGDPIWVDGPGRYDNGAGEMSDAKSRTYIPARLDDNAYLRSTGYRKQLESLPEPMRSAVLKGDWLAGRRDNEFQVLPSDWIRAAQARWTDEGGKQPMISMGVDVAQGGADRTAIAMLHANNWFAPCVLREGVDTKDGPAVGALIVQHQRNGAPIAIDMTGGWGGATREHLRQSDVDVHGIVFSNASGDVDPNTKIAYYNLRAQLYWQFRLALDPHGVERIALPPDARVLAEGTAPRWRLQGGKILIESKDEIRKRLGSSTDVMDAIVIAWAIRAKGLMKQGQARQPPAWAKQTADSDPFQVDGF